MYAKLAPSPVLSLPQTKMCRAKSNPTVVTSYCTPATFYTQTKCAVLHISCTLTGVVNLRLRDSTRIPRFCSLRLNANHNFNLTTTNHKLASNSMCLCISHEEDDSEEDREDLFDMRGPIGIYPVMSA